MRVPLAILAIAMGVLIDAASNSYETVSRYIRSPRLRAARSIRLQ
jgi:hypothetical protein